MFVDVHCHLSFPEFDEDRPEVIRRLREQNISLLIDPGTNTETSRRSIELSAHHEFIYATVGLHPHEISTAFSPETFSLLEALTTEPKVVGIGEIGLDYHYPGYDAKTQQEAFRSMLRIAKKHDLPAVVHSRDAWEDTLRILKEEQSSNLRGIMHCFSGNMEHARQCILSGFKISIPGTLTYKKSSLPEVVGEVAIGDLLTETDAPYLPPVPFRGKRNEPSYVRIVTEKIAAIKELTVEKTAAIIKNNVFTLFPIRRHSQTSIP
ncbi:MAG: TatD family hydrolase [Chlorobium phaeobacteroides]|uniref:Hydrolase, TatD family n=1 Tax=Chlorobium phaeobacteroides (strain BS1) TaxID=331678 RepID=B3ELA6_CHLPB|nr:TatD family hydrolase [Chlorobium phaeobacteroides]